MANKRYDQLFEILKKAPKPQLHLHLDGSLSFEFVMQAFNEMKLKQSNVANTVFNENNEPTNWQGLRNYLMNMKECMVESGGMIVKKQCNWKVFDFCNQFLQTYDQLCNATCDLVNGLYQEHNVNYIEIRFAPVLHTLRDLSIQQAIGAVVDGFNEAKKGIKSNNGDIDGGIILCALRSFPVDHCDILLDMIESYDDVIAFDIAGDEQSYPLELFKEKLIECRKRKINLTVHAGEWSKCIDNIMLATNIGVQRIGHAVALLNATKENLELIRQRNIKIEVNLTANCGNPLKCTSFAKHPIRIMLDNNLHVAALSCDNLLLSGNKEIGAPNPTIECVRALMDCSISTDELLNIIENGYKAGFSCHSKEITRKSIEMWKREIIPKLNEVLIKE